MRFLYKGKDGGPDSPVTGYWLIEIKWLFSIVILHFKDGWRENFHNHAFNALTWLLKGKAVEQTYKDAKVKPYKRSIFPKFTSRSNMHRVRSYGNTWMLSLRGPWQNTWEEYCPASETFITLTHGRKVL